jgi:quinol monooxygenase YgiN
MIVYLAKNRARPEMIETYEQAFRTMAAEVKATEPNALVYELSRIPAEGPTMYRGFEVYPDEKALQEHIDGITMRWLPILYDCLDREPEVERYDDFV